MKHVKVNILLALAVFPPTQHSLAESLARTSGDGFNPAIGLILDGRYTNIDNSELVLPGFQLGGEAGLAPNGFSTGHNELTLSANIDDKFFGSVTAPIVYENGNTEIELEEAFIETLALNNGFTIKGGKFFSGLGYLNSIHDHAHDFSDRPLIYDALFGGHLVDTGIQLKWLAPTPFYLSMGTEWTSGSEYPGGENKDNNSGKSLFMKTGGDINLSTSWQLGLAHYSNEFDLRSAEGHQHEGEHTESQNELHNGEVKINGVDFVYKWAPNGNAKDRNLKIQAEYFVRDESGTALFTEDTNSATGDYNGKQKGFYLQAVYQFQPGWSAGARYDLLTANNNIAHFVGDGIDQEEFLEESKLGNLSDNIVRYSLMVDYSTSHFSTLRLQYNTLDNGIEKNNSVTLQYIMSLGSHSSHTY